MGHELAALNVEIAHHHYRATLAASGVKRGKLPPPLHLDRPTPWQPDVEPNRAPRQSQTARADARHYATTVDEVVAVLSKGFKRG